MNLILKMDISTYSITVGNMKRADLKHETIN